MSARSSRGGELGLVGYSIHIHTCTQVAIEHLVIVVTFSFATD